VSNQSVLSILQRSFRPLAMATPFHMRSVRSPDAFDYPSHNPARNSGSPLPLVRKHLSQFSACADGTVQCATLHSPHISPRRPGDRLRTQPYHPQALAIPGRLSGR
jgi:hypothetical protein